METNHRQTRTNSRKSNRVLGMTPIQITILLILACFGLTSIGVLAGLIFYNTPISNIQQLAPISSATKTPSTRTPQPNNQISGCNSADVNFWIDQTVPRLNAIDSDLEFLNAYPPSSYDGYISYAESARQKYYAQLSQKTPACLANVQELALEELRLFWKGLEAASNGDRNALIDYFSRLVEMSSQVDQEIQKFEPTPTPIPSPTSTPAPTKIYLSGGDIGRMWSNDNHSIGLISVYRTNSFEGMQPSDGRLGGYTDGFKEFIVVNLQFERFSTGYDEFDISGFFLTSYTNDNYFEYDVKKIPSQRYEPFTLNYKEKVVKSIVFEVMSNSHNFVLCYGFTPGIYESGVIASWCGAEGYEFKFGD